MLQQPNKSILRKKEFIFGPSIVHGDGQSGMQELEADARIASRVRKQGGMDDTILASFLSRLRKSQSPARDWLALPTAGEFSYASQ